MALPKRIIIHELGPREGMQIEKTPIATSEKIRLVDLLSDCVFPEIEVTSFVSPKWVPQMADAEQVAAGFKRRPGTRYTCVYLNTQGMARAVGTQKLDVEGFYDKMEDVLSPRPLDPERAMMETIAALEEQVRTRVQSVENGR